MTHQEQLFFVYCTIGGLNEARHIAHDVVTGKLAACANILPHMTSVYHWQGEIQEDSECVVIFKTRSSLRDRLIARIKEQHPYDVPALFSIEVRPHNPAYTDWLFEQTLSD